MARRLLLLSLALGVLLLPTVASADSLVFTVGNQASGVGITKFTIGPGGIISNQVGTVKGKPVTLARLIGVQHAPSPPGLSFTGLNLGSVGFTTGSWSSTTVIDAFTTMYTYNGGITSNISIIANGTGFGGAIAANTSLFTGYFNGPVSFLVTTPNPLKPKGHHGDLTAKVITTSLSPTLLALLGMPMMSHGTAVSLIIDVKIGVGGGIQSGTITLVPEPGTLVLFGSGLVTLAGLLRKRLQ